jgi:hypothetical protein
MPVFELNPIDYTCYQVTDLVWILKDCVCLVVKPTKAYPHGYSFRKENAAPVSQTSFLSCSMAYLIVSFADQTKIREKSGYS